MNIRLIILSALCALTLVSCQKKRTETDLPQPEVIDGIELPNGYVDMGLSVKWAAMNFGAKEVTDPGEYYTWGSDVVVDGPVTEAGYKFINKTTGAYTDEYFIGDDLLEKDDVVASSIGSPIRMPRMDEAKELVANCDWKYVMLNGTKGYLATSQKNGAKLFFPCGGYYADKGLINLGFSVQIWVGTLSFEYNEMAYCISMSPIVKPGAGFAHRYLGIPVRAIQY